MADSLNEKTANDAKRLSRKRKYTEYKYDNSYIFKPITPDSDYDSSLDETSVCCSSSTEKTNNGKEKSKEDDSITHTCNCNVIKFLHYKKDHDKAFKYSFLLQYLKDVSKQNDVKNENMDVE